MTHFLANKNDFLTEKSYFCPTNTTPQRTIYMKKTFIILLLLLASLQAMAQHPEYGLHIQTYPHPSNEYTCVELEAGKAIELEGKPLTLEFRVQPRSENIFGSVFRILTDSRQNIDLMYSVSKDDRRFPMLVTGDKGHAIQQEVQPGIWIDVAITLNPKNGNIVMQYDSTRVEATCPALKGAKDVRIFFGLCRVEGFTLLDVASVNLKDIWLKREKRAVRHWKMGRHTDNACYDELAHVPAIGENMNWMIDKYITWKKIHSKHFDGNQQPSVTFDPDTGIFYIAADNHRLYTFRTQEQQADTLQIKGGKYAANYPNQLIYIPQLHQLLSYNLDENLFSAYDPTSQRWEGAQAPSQDHDYWNNTLTWNQADSSLVSFGGYGHYHFNNKLLLSYPYNRKPQQTVTLEEIHPRYSTASAIVDGMLYLFGGRGCPSGRQELSPRYYYDFYAIDLKTHTIKKLWEKEDTPEGGHLLPGENLVYDAGQACFYLLCMGEGCMLMRLNDHSAGLEQLSLPVEMKPFAQYIYKNLFYAPSQKKFYAAILQSQVSGESVLDLYELNYPPAPVEAFMQNAGEAAAMDQKGEERSLWPVLCLAGMAVAAGWVAVRTGRKRRKQKKAAVRQPETEAAPEARESLPGPVAPDAQSMQAGNDRKPGVWFFGGFRVIGRNGEDITPLFTPILKSLLLLLILHTGKDERGIDGGKMLQYLWPDKTEESAKNNRNVSMTKLRNLLKQVGDISIAKYGNFWNIQFGEDATCDYLKAMQLYKECQTEGLDQLLALLLHGSMLPNVENEWVDVFKNDFSNRTIDLLTQQLRQEKLPDTLLLKIADTLFQHDYINEEALQAKCRIFCRQGKKGLAKTVYTSFCKEYATLMGVPYERSLAEIIQEEES